MTIGKSCDCYVPLLLSIYVCINKYCLLVVFQISTCKHLWLLTLVGFQVPIKLLYCFPFSTGQREKKWQGLVGVISPSYNYRQNKLDYQLITVGWEIQNHLAPNPLSQTTGTSCTAECFLPKEDGIVWLIWRPFCPQTELPCCVGPYQLGWAKMLTNMLQLLNGKGDAEHQAHVLILYSL